MKTFLLFFLIKEIEKLNFILFFVPEGIYSCKYIYNLKFEIDFLLQSVCRL